MRLLRACSGFLAFILNETEREVFAVLCSAHCSECASGGRSDLRLSIAGVTLCHIGSAFRREVGVVCREREGEREVSQAVVDGGRARQEKAESSFQPLLNIS